MGHVIQFGCVNLDLGPSPIRPSWIREGTPVARITELSRSADRTAWTIVWDCTAGRFDWHYALDETVCVLDGSVLIQQEDGTARLLNTGDTAFFPAGSSAQWTVETYIRKVAFMRVPVYGPIAFLNRACRGMYRRFSGTQSGSDTGF